MSKVYIQKRGKAYQYRFAVAPVNGKRKSISKSGFRTKKEAINAGLKAYNDYLNGEINNKSDMSYGDYLDYWLINYCELNYKYRTLEEYSLIIKKYLKPDLGSYKLKNITSFQLNNYLIEVCNKYDYSQGYLRNFLKVIKSSFRDAADIFGFIDYNPAITLRMPRLNVSKKTP